MKETGYEFLVMAYKQVIVLGAENVDLAAQSAVNDNLGIDALDWSDRVVSDILCKWL